MATAFSTVSATTATDSLNRNVAVFVASNMKIAISNALAQIASVGINCDTVAVKQMICDELGKPYDKAAYDAAEAAIIAAAAEKDIRQGAAMLAEAEAEDGAVKLPDGLVILTTKQGDTTKSRPEPTSTVSIRYTGKLPDGSVFDSIGPDEAPLTSLVSNLAPGIAEGLTHMYPGGKSVLTIPAGLAYGHEGVPGVIPPDCPIRFEVELVDVK